MARKVKKIEITSVGARGWTIPYYGNTHYTPYGTLVVRGKVDGKEVTQDCRTHGDKHGDHPSCQYIVFQGVRFKVRNKGTMYYPELYLEEWEKELINGRWMYV